VLIPAPKQRHFDHKIRIAIHENPKWYKEVYAAHGRIRRYLILPSLNRIAQGQDRNFSPKDHKYTYDSLFRSFIFERLTGGCEDLMDYLHPNKEICSFFQLPWKNEEGLEQVVENTVYYSEEDIKPNSLGYPSHSKL